MRYLLMVLAMLLIVACSRSTPGIGAAPPPGRDSVIIEVDNRHFLDATIAVRYEAGAATRLGVVRGQNRDTFFIPWQPSRVVFGIDLIGSGEFITDPPIVLDHDDIVGLIIPHNLDRGVGGFRRIR